MIETSIRHAMIADEYAERKRVFADEIGRLILDFNRTKSREREVQARMDRVPRFSSKWWHLLGSLNILVRDRLTMKELLDEVRSDPRAGAFTHG